ncbi:MAG: 4a-hydroxytetrahydrobiopterin dehydratase [Thermodesulfobacteriota bacterium]
MIDLARKKCEACRVGAPLATEAEIEEYMQQLPEWKIVEIDGIKRLTRTCDFNNFMEAMSFSNRIAAIAEEQNHHPSIVTEWGKVTVTWWSHIIKGIHLNDFIMAAKTDELIKKP